MYKTGSDVDTDGKIKSNVGAEMGMYVQGTSGVGQDFDLE
jgi:hypothetical protein